MKFDDRTDEYKTVRLREDTWHELALRKAKSKTKTFDETIRNLLK